MFHFPNLSVTHKIIIGILLGFILNVYLIMAISEEQLEKAMMEQVTKQAQSYLLGLSLQMERMPAETTGEQYRQIILAGMAEERHAFLHFSPLEIYLYSQTGQVISHSQEGTHPDKPMDGVYGQVIRQGKPQISMEMKGKNNGGNKSQATIDVIIPVRLASKEYNAGLEAELDMGELLDLIRSNDDSYEKHIFLLSTATALLVFLLVWGMIHRLILRHIHQFAQTMRAFGAGAMEQRIPSPLPKDEVGQLGLAINSMADNIERLMSEQEENYLQTLQSLSKALEAKDAYTQSHSARVSKYAVMLGKYMGMPKEKLNILQKGALMHDLGKIGIPDSILNKPASLSDEEFAIMKTHATYTATIMRPLHRFHEFLEIAAWHHERWDGKGYPDGLQGEQIPLLARIVSIADTWDAMTGDRVYRKGMPREKALSILAKEWNSGQWDPQLMQSFIRMIESENSPNQ
ncbi:MAG: HD-GYP domain-containing protein [Magnetococcales bacterium]|nr:HD-GYP domain-containing protein [Magnetococcales bacterium]